MTTVDRHVHVKMWMTSSIATSFAKNYAPSVRVHHWGTAGISHASSSSLVDMASPGWDASLSDHVLKNLRATDAGFSEKELQDHLTMLEIKLR